MTSFQWDETKRLSNIEKHQLDFYDAAEIFSADHLTLPARSNIEPRFIAVGALAEEVIAVIYTIRDDSIRIISARKARTDEREQYQDLHARRNPPDEISH
ncbi:MAG: BrnT family toxin [Alphaproteobacteria bacterium]|nr:BrnT family toxin [Alphaproteobacteria bacterium]